MGETRQVAEQWKGAVRPSPDVVFSMPSINSQWKDFLFKGLSCLSKQVADELSANVGGKQGCSVAQQSRKPPPPPLTKCFIDN